MNDNQTKKSRKRKIQTLPNLWAYQPQYLIINVWLCKPRHHQVKLPDSLKHVQNVKEVQQNDVNKANQFN